MSRPVRQNPSAEREPTCVEQAALGWVVRSERGLSPAEERELASWLAADAEHRELFAEFGGTWVLMERWQDAASPKPGRGAAEATIHSFAARGRSREGGRARRRRARRWLLSLAAAAVVAIGFIRPWHSESGAARGAAIATEVGKSRRLTLSDGSTVALNTDSTVVPAVAPDERRIRLEKGEAFFQVAKDAARPFVVEAAGVGVRAVGTAFNVRVHPASIDVLVTEGKVRVAPRLAGLGDGGDFIEVAAGERVSVPVGLAARAPAPPEKALAVARVPADEVQRRLAWQGGRLDFSDTPLGEMVTEFNRYNRRKLAVPDAELAAMRFGGSFRPDDRAGFVRMLHENFGIVAEEEGERTVLRAAR